MEENIDKGQATERSPRRGRHAHTFEKLYTMKDACELLSIKKRTIYSCIDRGVIPWIIKTPGGIRVPASALAEFSHQRRIDTCHVSK